MKFVNGDGFPVDENGFPLDVSGAPPYQDNVDLPGQYGRGGFFNPETPGGGGALTPNPAGPPPGVSLSSKPGNMNLGHGDGPGETIFRPQNSPLRPGASPAIRNGPGPYTDVFPQQSGPGWAGVIPSLLSRFGLPLAAGSAALAGIHNENQPGNVPAHGTGPPDVMSPEEIYKRQQARPSVPAAPIATPFTQPSETGPENVGNIVPQYGMPFPQYSGSPDSIARGMPGRAIPAPVQGAPIPPGGIHPARPAPRAAGPAAAKQQPNLGAYSPFTTIAAPNVDPTRRERLGNPQTTALDLSRFFGSRPNP